MNSARPETKGREGEYGSAVRAEIRNIGIPPRPVILERIETEMGKDEPDFRRLADIVTSDVALAGSLIKVANSPVFGFGKKVRSVAEALIVLGLKVILHTVAGHALRNLFPHMPSLERFWDTAAHTAHTSGWIAARFKRRLSIRSEDAYTYGLFRDCGIPVLMIPFPEYPAILGAANQDAATPFTEIEDRALSLNHAIVGTQLVQDWRLPEEIAEAIRHHHDIAYLEREDNRDLRCTQQLIAVAQLAEFLIQTHTGLNHTSEWSKLGPACLRRLEIEAGNLEEIVAASHDFIAGLS